MRRRKRARYTWLPTWGQDRGEGEPTIQTYQTVNVTVSSEASSFGVVGLLEDFPTEDESAFAQQSMADLIGSDYVVRRIVGKMFVHAEYNNTADFNAYSQPPVMVKAGIFVARADSAQSNNVPVGWTSSNAQDNYNPFNRLTQREPWLWQRSWVLGQGRWQDVTFSTSWNPGTAALRSDF